MAIPYFKKDSHIVIWNKHKQCYREYNESDFTIDGETLRELKWNIVDEYKNKLISRLIPHFNDLSEDVVKENETYKAIIEIANELKGV